MRRDVYAGLTSTILVLLFFAACFAGCTSQAPAAPVTAAPTAAVTQAEPQTLVIATTTSLYDTKLLDYLQTKFEAKNNVKLKITSQGTGKGYRTCQEGRCRYPPRPLPDTGDCVP